MDPYTAPDAGATLKATPYYPKTGSSIGNQFWQEAYYAKNEDGTKLSSYMQVPLCYSSVVNRTPRSGPQGKTTNDNGSVMSKVPQQILVPGIDDIRWLRQGDHTLKVNSDNKKFSWDSIDFKTDITSVPVPPRPTDDDGNGDGNGNGEDDDVDDTDVDYLNNPASNPPLRQKTFRIGGPPGYYFPVGYFDPTKQGTNAHTSTSNSLLKSYPEPGDIIWYEAQKIADFSTPSLVTLTGIPRSASLATDAYQIPDHMVSEVRVKLNITPIAIDVPVEYFVKLVRCKYRVSPLANFASYWFDQTKLIHDNDIPEKRGTSNADVKGGILDSKYLEDQQNKTGNLCNGLTADDEFYETLWCTRKILRHNNSLKSFQIDKKVKLNLLRSTSEYSLDFQESMDLGVGANVRPAFKKNDELFNQCFIVVGVRQLDDNQLKPIKVDLSYDQNQRMGSDLCIVPTTNMKHGWISAGGGYAPTTLRKPGGSGSFSKGTDKPNNDEEYAVPPQGTEYGVDQTIPARPMTTGNNQQAFLIDECQYNNANPFDPVKYTPNPGNNNIPDMPSGVNAISRLSNPRYNRLMAQYPTLRIRGHLTTIFRCREVIRSDSLIASNQIPTLLSRIEELESTAVTQSDVNSAVDSASDVHNASIAALSATVSANHQTQQAVNSSLQSQATVNASTASAASSAAAAAQTSVTALSTQVAAHTDDVDEHQLDDISGVYQKADGSVTLTVTAATSGSHEYHMVRSYADGSPSEDYEWTIDGLHIHQNKTSSGSQHLFNISPDGSKIWSANGNEYFKQ